MATNRVSEDMEFLAGMVSRNEDGTYSVVQDFCYESNEEPDQAVAEFARIHGVSAEILKLSGPAGGWPEVEFTGTLPAIADILFDFSPSTSDMNPSEQDKQALYSLIRKLAG